MTLVVYTCLSVARSVDELSGLSNPSGVTEVLTNASRGAPFAPVMSLLFLSYRMFVLASTAGLGEPQAWVKAAMVVSTAGYSLQVLTSLCAGIFSVGAVTP